MLIDSHCHLFHEDFAADLSEVLQRARDVGIGMFVVPGTDLATSRRAVELASATHDIRAATGIHPHDAAKASAGDLEAIRDLAVEGKAVAIGEIGLDYFYDFSPPEIQKELFRAQIELAAEHGLPIIVHTRDSISDAIQIVREGVEHWPAWCSEGGVARRGVFHCFTGSVAEARALFELGFYVSYPGILTFKKSPVVEQFRALNMERILVETDAPYLAPVPYRGKRNEPSYMIETTKVMSALTARSPEEVAEITTRNARELFGLT